MPGTLYYKLGTFRGEMPTRLVREPKPRFFTFALQILRQVTSVPRNPDISQGPKEEG